MRAQRTLLRRKARQVFLPEQAAQDRIDIQRQQLLACQAGGQRGDAVVFLISAMPRRFALATARLATPCIGMRWISRPAATWSLAASTSVASSCSDWRM